MSFAGAYALRSSKTPASMWWVNRTLNLVASSKIQMCILIYCFYLSFNCVLSRGVFSRTMKTRLFPYPTPYPEPYPEMQRFLNHDQAN